MNRRPGWLAAVLASAALVGCATLPEGPSVLVLPGQGRGFEQFQVDNAVCRDFAHQQVGGRSTGQALNESTARTAATTAILGAAVGAAVDGGQGAGIGAASGALLGTAVGAGVGSESAWETQRRYDNAYQQCMYAKGHQVPTVSVNGHVGARAYAVLPPPPPGGSTSSRVPPPPPGPPPPPPPDLR
jgi:hypothetical protein